MRKLAFFLVSCAMATVAWAAEPTPYDWGPLIKTFEPSASGDYKGTFVRRGTTNVYDAEWIYVPTGQKIVDVLEVRGIVKGELIVYRRGNQGTYTMPIKNGVMGRGKASWVSDPTYYWEVVSQPASPPPAVDEKWLVAKAADGAFGYDVKSIRKAATPGHKIVHWAVYAPKPVQDSGGAWSFAMWEGEFNCTARSFAPLTVVTFDRAGKPLDTVLAAEKPVWKTTPEKGIHAMLHGLTCEDSNLEKSRTVATPDALFTELERMAR